ncbi:hypothetical protein [Aliiruegeria lutimaris]|uniref:Uncharacterized protein n=1 Tax=Aliiruegeria lutimaris TaxID=571298 RepID=A0A1G9DAV3_9RHOB|nr:hypothetical protein [Aliiruegeria lutimaris]SDK60967.1 hypothetical protein SAMN04488026_104631 [Aliiruegeria lutimaris]
MPTHSMYVYPWDLRDEGVCEVAARLRDASIDSVSVATSYHAGKFLRPHGPQGKVYFPEDGTVYFRPSANRYRVLAPQQARMAREYDALSELSRHAPDLGVTAWTVGLHNSRLGAAHPDLAVETAFGDRLINSLCPSQPEVRHFAKALCADAASQPGVREVALEAPGWQAFRHGHHHEFELIELPDVVQIMLGTCFCTACLSRASAAGIDGDGLKRAARTDLEDYFHSGAAPVTDPKTDPDWVAYFHLRAETVTSMASEIRAEMPFDATLAIIPTTQSPNDLCWIEGSDLAGLASAADRIEIPAYQNGVAAISSDATRAARAAGNDAALGFILRPTYPNLAGAEDVTRAVEALRALRPTSISFYNYGHMRLESLDWIAAALTAS